MRDDVTEAEIAAAATPRGGWTRETMQAWGVPWPPPKGWRKAITARELASKANAAIEEKETARATIIADASLNPRSKLAGWAGWIKTDKMPAGKFFSGVLKTAPQSSSVAEAMSIVNTIILAAREGLLEGVGVLMIQNDNIGNTRCNQNDRAWRNRQRRQGRRRSDTGARKAQQQSKARRIRRSHARDRAGRHRQTHSYRTAARQRASGARRKHQRNAPHQYRMRRTGQAPAPAGGECSKRAAAIQSTRNGT